MIDKLAEAFQSWTWLELLAVITSLLYTILAARENIWCWFFSLVSILFYSFIFFEAKLLAESLLQIYYLGTTFYGFYQWKYNKGKGEDQKPIERLSTKQHFIAVIIIILGAAGLGWSLSFTDASMPFLDSFTTVGAIVTTYLVAKKYLENWLYWIVVDGVGVYLFFQKELYLTALLFLIYTFLVIYGYTQWLSIYKKQGQSYA